MRLCTWFAGIDLDSRILTATLGFSSDGSAPRILGSQSVDVASHGPLPSVQCAVREAVTRFGEWFHLESGGALTSVALAVPGSAIRSVPSSGECQFGGPVVVDSSAIDQAKERALQHPRRLGTLLRSEVRGYELDGHPHESPPLGVYATSLRVTVEALVAQRELVDPAVEAIEMSGFEAGSISVRAAAAAETVLTPLEQQEGAIVVTIGETESEIAVLIDSSLIDFYTVPLGRAPLVAELARACNVSHDVIGRLDLGLMIDRVPADPMVQRVRSVMSGWGIALFTGVRRRLDDRDLTRRVKSGLVIAHSARSLPLLDECAGRVIGVPARYAPLSQFVAGGQSARSGSPASHGLIAMEWKALHALPERANPIDLGRNAAHGTAPVQSSARGGIGQALGRWLREFVPADSH